MKQFEAVIKVMEENGGYATLGHLYQHVLKIPNCEWKTKTPFASIRRIVQDSRFFFKIKPGLWALNKHKDEIVKQFEIGNSKSIINQEFTHTYFQGLVAEIGNCKGFTTYVPPQDKNRKYLNKKLNEVVSLENIYEFTYPHVINKAKTIDIIWFNQRKYPHSVFEVEHSTSFYNSLLKFTELIDFSSKFFIVSDVNRKKEYESKITLDAFSEIQNRVTFLDYEKLSKWHSNAHEMMNIEREVGM